MTENALITQEDIAAIVRINGTSAVSEQVALQLPLAELVEATIGAACHSTHTERSYRTAIGLFLQHLDSEKGGNIPEHLADQWRPFAEPVTEGQRTVWLIHPAAAVLRLVTPSLVDTFRTWREAEGDRPNTASIRVHAVKTFLAVAYRDGAITTEQATRLSIKPYRQRQKRDEQPVGRRLSKLEVQSLRSAPNILTNKGKRDLAILEMMLFAGLRRDEVARLDLSNIRQDNGRWWLILSGKGDKTRRLKIHDTLYRSLTAWLTVSDLDIEAEGCIFRSVNKADRIGQTCVNASVIGRLVAEYGHKARLAPLRGSARLSAHDLRRTAARNAYDHGAPLLLVQAMLGHSDPKTTARYIGAFESDDNMAVDKIDYSH